jgi:phosphatidate phosphatase APP1
LIGPKGLSVVSDIDDTIKISSVTVKEELMANTFFRPWRAVPGMAALYQQWGQEGAVFHYVSNSPWPLETVLEFFLSGKGSPRHNPFAAFFRPWHAGGISF